MAENNNNRIDYVDLFRGIGIILMVFGHMKFKFVEGGIGNEISDVYYHLIHAFHMPLFFFLSGYCFHKTNIRTSRFVANKAKKLLIPYLVFGVGEYILWRIFEGDSLSPLFHLFWVNTKGLAIAGALWFLTALFIAVTLYFLMDRYLKNMYLLSVVCTVVAIAGCFLAGLMSHRFPFAIDAAMAGIGFVHVGRLIRLNSEKRHIQYLLNLKTYMILILGIINVAMIMYNDSINMRVGRYSNIALFWINALIAIIQGLNICIKTNDMASNNRIIEAVTSRVKHLGRDGIIYVCVNELVITVFARILNRYVESMAIYNVLLVTLVFISLWMICVIIKRLFRLGNKKNEDIRA